MAREIKLILALPDILEGRLSPVNINRLVEAVKIIDDLGYMSRESSDYFDSVRNNLRRLL